MPAPKFARSIMISTRVSSIGEINLVGIRIANTSLHNRKASLNLIEG